MTANLKSMLELSFLMGLIHDYVRTPYDSMIRDRQRWGTKTKVGHVEGIIAPGFYGKTMYRNYIRSKKEGWARREV